MSSFKSIKIVTVGDTGVGKTCMLISYTTNSFPLEYVPTVFDDYAATLKVNGEDVSVGFWDTAGDKEYAKLRVLSYPDTDIFIICFSVDSIPSFDSVQINWAKELDNHCPKASRILVGTKSDLRNDTEIKDRGNFVSEVKAKKLAKEIGCICYMECSALKQTALKQVFDKTVIQGLKIKEKKEEANVPQGRRCVVM